MGNYLNQLRLKIREGEFDEHLEGLFNTTLNFAVLGFLAAFCIMLQLGCFEYYSDALKLPMGIVWPVFPN